MNVLHVIGKMPRAGAEHYLAGTLRAATGLWNPTLCVLNAGYPLTGELAADGIPTIELTARHRRDLRRWAALRHTITSGGFDVVHATLWRAGVIARLMALRRHRPALVVAEQNVEWFRPRWQRYIDRALSTVTDAYIGNSVDVADFISWAHGVSRRRVTVIPNGLDTSVFHVDGPAWERTTVPRVGFAGRLTEQKGVDVLIDAVRYLVGACEVDVVIVGDGPDRSALETAASDLPIRFVGRVEEPHEMAGFMRSLDVFVLPSRWEGMPNVVVEAAACGAAIVTTNAPGVRSAAPPEARIVPVDDARALAGAIRDAVEHRLSTSPWVGGIPFHDVAALHKEVFEQALARR